MEYINTSVSVNNEVIGLLIAVCDQVGIEHKGKPFFGVQHNQRDVMNRIASIYNINVAADNVMSRYSKIANTIAERLVSQGILDEARLKSDLHSYLLRNPSLRL